MTIAAWAAMALALSAQQDAVARPGAAATPAAGTAADPVHDRAALRADLQLLRRAITESHPGAYRYRPASQIAAAFDAAERRLGRSGNALAFYRILLPAITALRDGHTQLMLPEASDQQWRETTPLPPFRFHVADGRLFIARDLRARIEGDGLAGREVLAINGRPFRRIIADLSAAQSGDGTIPSSRVAALRTLRFNRLFGLLYGGTPAYHLVLAGTRPVEVSGEPYEALRQRLVERFPAEGPRPPAELAFIDEGATAILSIRSFAGPANLDGSVLLRQFIPDSFAQLRQRGTRSLIIDLRGNNGGRDELGRILLQHLLDRPFAYYRGLYLNGRDISFAAHADNWRGRVPDDVAMPDEQGRLRLLRHPNLGEQAPAPNRFGGRVLILMDGGSFSTTAEFLSLVHFHRRATLIGEESGGGYYGDCGGVVLTLTLPNSGLRVRIPMVRYELAVSGFSPADRGAPPDEVIAADIADVLSGRDRVMERALSLARGG